MSQSYFNLTMHLTMKIKKNICFELCTLYRNFATNRQSKKVCRKTANKENMGKFKDNNSDFKKRGFNVDSNADVKCSSMSAAEKSKTTPPHRINRYTIAITQREQLETCGMPKHHLDILAYRMYYLPNQNSYNIKP